MISQLDLSIVALRLKQLPGTNDFEPEVDMEEEDPRDVPPGTIDVWWRGQKNGELMLLLTHLLTLNDEWRHRTIRLLRVVENESAKVEVEQHLRQLSEDSRIETEAISIVSTSVPESIQTHPRFAAIVIIGFEAPEDGTEIEFFESLEKLTGELPRVLLVDSAGGMKLTS